MCHQPRTCGARVSSGGRARLMPPLVGLPPNNWELFRQKKYLPIHFMETTRGCPIDCEFCAVTTAFGGKFRNRPQDEVLAELR